MGFVAEIVRSLVNGPRRNVGAPERGRVRSIGSTLERATDRELERLDPLWRPAASEGTHDTTRWPVEPTTGQPIAPRPQPGYYPGYHTLDQQAFWDEATRQLVLDRVRNVPPIRFFTENERRLMEAIVDRLLPQDDREAAYRVPIVPQIDKKLFEDRISGYRYEDMPPQREAMRLGLEGIEAIAAHLFGQSFVTLGPTEQDEVLLTLHDGRPPAGQEIWKRMPPIHFWVNS